MPPLALPPRRLFKETAHCGMPCGLYRMRGKIWLEDEEISEMGYLEKRKEGSIIQICRLWGFTAKLLGVDEGTAAIIINSASIQALKAGDFATHETTLIPGEDRWSWRTAWSIARKLASANPGRPAVIPAGEWGMLDHVDLAPFHSRSIISIGIDLAKEGTESTSVSRLMLPSKEGGGVISLVLLSLVAIGFGLFATWLFANDQWSLGGLFLVIAAMLGAATYHMHWEGSL